MRRRTISFLTAAVLTASLVPLAFAASVPDYRTLITKVRKQSVEATLGARCVPTPQGPDCPTTVPAYPLKTTGTLKVKRGDAITLLFRARIGDVTWRAARINGYGKEVPTATGVAKLITRKTKRQWRITLPKNLRKSSKILGITAESPNARADFEVGLQVR